MCKRAVGIAERKFEEKRRNELENIMRNQADGGNYEEAGYDRWYIERGVILIRCMMKAGVVRQGKESVEVWRKYFEKV